MMCNHINNHDENPTPASTERYSHISLNCPIVQNCFCWAYNHKEQNNCRDGRNCLLIHRCRKCAEFHPFSQCTKQTFPCKYYNRGKCHKKDCMFLHICDWCYGSVGHGAAQCFEKKMGRPRKFPPNVLIMERCQEQMRREKEEKRGSEVRELEFSKELYKETEPNGTLDQEESPESNTRLSTTEPRTSAKLRLGPLSNITLIPQIGPKTLEDSVLDIETSSLTPSCTALPKDKIDVKNEFLEDKDCHLSTIGPKTKEGIDQDNKIIQKPKTFKEEIDSHYKPRQSTYRTIYDKPLDNDKHSYHSSRFTGPNPYLKDRENSNDNRKNKHVNSFFKQVPYTRDDFKKDVERFGLSGNETLRDISVHLQKQPSIDEQIVSNHGNKSKDHDISLDRERNREVHEEKKEYREISRLSRYRDYENSIKHESSRRSSYDREYDRDRDHKRGREPSRDLDREIYRSSSLNYSKSYSPHVDTFHRSISHKQDYYYENSKESRDRDRKRQRSGDRDSGEYRDHRDSKEYRDHRDSYSKERSRESSILKHRTPEHNLYRDHKSTNIQDLHVDWHKDRERQREKEKQKIRERERSLERSLERSRKEKELERRDRERDRKRLQRRETDLHSTSTLYSNQQPNTRHYLDELSGHSRHSDSVHSNKSNSPSKHSSRREILRVDGMKKILF